MTALGGLALLVIPPAALILSVIGVVRRQDRTAGIVGVILSGATLLLIFGFPLLMMLCK